MENRKKKLPIGIEDFEKIRTEEFYYVDKTGLIRELLDNWGMVNLFTRPRRFGKSLNMSMLEHFFSMEGDKVIFEGLEIAKNTELCKEYMGKFPVISISLKGIHAGGYQTAFDMAVKMINREARRFQYLLQSEKLTMHDKEAFTELFQKDMDEATLACSLAVLSELLFKHYGKKVILLIDEYDVPLAKAFEHGYYDQMLSLLRNVFENALKTNDNLKFAVLTGCMRISKESIFTGLNNLKVLSAADVRFDEYFGFTPQEVEELLAYYDLLNDQEVMKEWYDGYQFGNVEVYCPWDVINYCDLLRADPDAKPQNFWSNTSSNDAVRKFIQKADRGTTKREIEKLIAGDVITKEIHQELTYKDMYHSIENIWSVLFTSGYLTQRGKADGNFVRLAIPNMEIRNIFTTQIMELFREDVRRDGQMLEAFCDALKNKNVSKVEQCLEEYLKKTISILDTFVKKQLKENFYHGILLGILAGKTNWGIYSNKEAGDGYSDIQIETDEEKTGIIIEVKYAQDGNLELACQNALHQIETLHYEEVMKEEGTDSILKYGIAFYKKHCKVMSV